MSTWFTADLHLGHANIIQYCARPFTDVEAMNRALIQRWNEVVNDGDDVWVLGDVAMGKIAETLPLVSELRGRKLLLTGNHDRCWDGHGRRAEGWTERYLDTGFTAIHHGEIEVEVGPSTAVACHFPIAATATTASSSSDRSIVVAGCSTGMCTSAGDSTVG
jgi:calcineurin-like phosphoesterase family protein